VGIRCSFRIGLSASSVAVGDSTNERQNIDLVDARTLKKIETVTTKQFPICLLEVWHLFKFVARHISLASTSSFETDWQT
jgi:hypothetical protein